MEEGHELVERITKKENLPLLTSCCPGWINFIENEYPDYLHLPSTAKSPHEMFGAIAKSYYAEKMGIDSKNIVVVSIMPCLAKKKEAVREELSNDGLSNVDYVLTTRELANMIKETGVKLHELPNGEFDNPLGESTGAADIFGASGGVLEAAIRNVKFTLEDNMNNICGKRCKYCDIKVNNMYYYISEIRYEVAYIRVWINYINSLKPLGEFENSNNF